MADVSKDERVTNMSKTHLLIVRHGETDWNRARRFQGSIDIPLNDTGHQQAIRLARRLEKLTIDAIYSSDLQRCLQTVDPTAQAHGLEVIPTPTLRERNYGLFEGLTLAEIEERHPLVRAAWGRLDPDYAIPGGESTRVLYARIVAAIHQIATRHPGQTLLVVTHGGVLDMIYRAAMNLSLAQVRQCQIPNAAFNQITFEQGFMQVVAWADDAHLVDS